MKANSIHIGDKLDRTKIRVVRSIDNSDSDMDVEAHSGLSYH